jgi:hypothetical protein
MRNAYKILVTVQKENDHLELRKSTEHGDAPSDLGEYFDQVRDCWLLKKHSALLRSFAIKKVKGKGKDIPVTGHGGP